MYLVPSFPALALAAAATLALAGCRHAPQYEQPTDPDVLACLEVCQAQRNDCVAPVRAERAACEQRRARRYARWQRCMGLGRPSSCGQLPSGCPTGEYPDHCRVSYHQCFLGCGGRLNPQPGSPER